MYLKYLLTNKSAIKNCTAQTEAEERQGIGPNNCQQPYDAMELMFRDELGNVILYYHLMSENPFVPGFNKGACKIPELYKPISEATRAERRKMLPRGCGGIHKTKVKKGFNIPVIFRFFFMKLKHLQTI